MNFRAATGVFACAAAACALAGCSMMGGAVRDDATGQVMTDARIKAADLRVGDCFSYLDNNANAEEVEINPCADTHAFVVFDQGTLSPADVTAAGSLQAAVATACQEPFEDFAAELPKGESSTQEFLVSKYAADADNMQHYSCVATSGF